ncbi:putative mitochondrial protein, partial [Globisporangium polare]
MRTKVLAAFQGPIGALLTPQERWSLAHASRWLRASNEAPRDAPEHSATAGLFLFSPSTPDEFAAKVQELHSSLICSYRSVQSNDGSSKNSVNKPTRRQRGSVLISAAKLSVVMRGLVLVAMGIRASCLVDCCALERPFVALLLETLSQKPAGDFFGCDFSHVYAVMLQGNVFFVHAQRFLQQKCADIASVLSNLVVVNVSAHLQQPQVIIPAFGNSNTSVHGTRANEIVQVVEAICDQLVALVVDSSSRENCILELRETRISTTALAGILLCYPVIYDLYDPSAANTEPGGGSGWDVQENCLSMCPLFVLQTSIA